MSGFASRQHGAGQEPLQIPFPGAAAGLVEIIEIKDKAAVVFPESSEIDQVGVAAELAVQACGGPGRKVRGHQRRIAPEEIER